eukprot:scaffold8465_cov60-Phaeocystis_antarctica.AAC.2
MARPCPWQCPRRGHGGPEQALSPPPRSEGHECGGRGRVNVGARLPRAESKEKLSSGSGWVPEDERRC